MARIKPGYFSDFPSIVYQGKIAKNLMQRPKIKDMILGSPNTFYDYTVKEDLRPDQVAALYYDDPNLVWLVFLANNIVDPYYGWPLTQHQLEDFMVDKYGTLDIAKSTIVHYKHKTKGTILSKDTKELSGTFNTTYGASDYNPVYAYDFEDELNEAKRNIKLVDRRLANKARTLLRDVMIG